MKKVYTKPEIMFESFSLSQAIAGDCDPKTWTPSRGTCAYVIEDEFLGAINVFLDDVDACTTKEAEDGADGAYNGICYHVPYGESLFNS